MTRAITRVMTRAITRVMARALWLSRAALALAGRPASAQPPNAPPKLLVNARLDSRPGAALQREFQTLLTTQPQPAWIMYAAPAVRTYNLGCDYVRDGLATAGVVHLEPPSHAL